MQHILISRDNKGKCRVVKLELVNNTDSFTIKRSSGLLNGKAINQPEIIITKGKVKRTLEEQALLEYNSALKKYKDKGYKDTVELGITELTEAAFEEKFPKDKTNLQGNLKPMLCKQYQDVSESKFNKIYYASRKINGVRCLIFWKDGAVHTSSRGAITYDVAIKHIINHPELVAFFKRHPDYILDGEIYKKGLELNTISGKCRKQEESNTSDLEYYLYDIVDQKKSFTDRLTLINTFVSELNLKFNPNKVWHGELQIQAVPHEEISGLDKIIALHDDYVREGWEGLVMRLASEVYHPGGRSDYMIKVKRYQEREYEIVGLAEGLREEDMCFVMKTPLGFTFNAKPIGTREEKQEYRKNIDSLIGKMATIKYFEMSGANTDIPQQPIFICVRNYE